MLRLKVFLFYSLTVSVSRFANGMRKFHCQTKINLKQAHSLLARKKILITTLKCLFRFAVHVREVRTTLQKSVFNLVIGLKIEFLCGRKYDIVLSHVLFNM